MTKSYAYIPPRPSMIFNLFWVGLLGALLGFLTAEGQHSLMVPYAGIGADIITGFPGETDNHFEQTMNLLRELPITHFHPFPYSSRKNTLAAKMDCHVHPSFKKLRMQSLISLGQAKLDCFSEEQVGSINDVLFERLNKKGMWEKGAPAFLITSLHSQSEYPDKNDDGSYKKHAYNRICDMKTGQCTVREHNDTYEVCQKVCIEDSCMIYVPYANRYKKEVLAECLIQPKDVDSSTQPKEPTTE